MLRHRNGAIDLAPDSGNPKNQDLTLTPLATSSDATSPLPPQHALRSGPDLATAARFASLSKAADELRRLDE